MARMVENQVELRRQLVSDPLLPMRFVKTALTISESKLNALIKSGELGPVIRFGKNGHRRLRASTLKAFMQTGGSSNGQI